MNFSFYQQIPLGLDFAIFLAILLVSLELGYRIGMKRKEAWTEIEEADGKLSLTSMFAIHGLMLAFTFGAAISRHEARKKSVIADSNALSTAFLRAGLIDDGAHAVAANRRGDSLRRRFQRGARRSNESLANDVPDSRAGIDYARHPGL